MNRREFLERVGGGIVISIAAGAQEPRPQAGYPQDINAYLVIGAEGRVTVLVGKIEMGQGVMTSLAQMAAEELGIELGSVEMVMGDTDRCPSDMGTFGSLSTRQFGPALRAAAAQARATLVALGARRLSVAPERLQARDGFVGVVGDASRRVGYGELARGARIEQVLEHPAPLATPADFRVMGSSPPRLDAVAKVTGGAKYAADLRLPGMLYAAILRPPRHGAKPTRIDTTAAARRPGISVVPLGESVALLHLDPEAAAAALAQVQAEWQGGSATPDTEGIFEHLVAHAGPAKDVVVRGDVASARAAAARVFEARYRKGYVAHVPIEPHAALADVHDGRATVWASTQTPFPTRDHVAQALGLAADRVRVVTPFLGGGFGGKSADGQAVEAARLSQAAGRPVQVAWTREEEFFLDTFDPAAVVDIASAIDREGRIGYWDSSVYAAGERACVAAYDIAHQRVRSAGGLGYGGPGAAAALHPFGVGPWRGPGANMNVFAIESQIETMAAAAGIDALAFRLANLKDTRMRRVLQEAARAFGWQAPKGARGLGRGIACVLDAGTCVATIAEVAVERASGRIQVRRVVCAQDMGIVVNPEGARMQIEGGITMGLGYTLGEELRFKGGEILDRNFGSYTITHFSALPLIEALLVRNDALAPQGGGEPAITSTGGAVANAVFDACGVRLLRLPMTPERVRAALNAA